MPGPQQRDRRRDTVMINSSTTGVLIAATSWDVGCAHRDELHLILPFARMNPLLNVTLVGRVPPSTEALVAPRHRDAQQYHAEYAFIAPRASAPHRVTAHVAEEAAVVKKLTERSETTILVTDSSKYGKPASSAS